jgi:hypothetical protein
MRDPCKVCFLDSKGSISNTFQFPDSTTSISIYSDDSIRIIKQKILYGIRSQISNLSLEEMYLFISVKRPFVLLNWYKHVTYNETVPLKRDIFCQLLLNLLSMEHSEEDELLHILNSSQLK